MLFRSGKVLDLGGVEVRRNSEWLEPLGSDGMIRLAWLIDPAAIRYSDLLEVFWANHDPTTLNRQGPDWGSQYRSVIFYHSPEQEAEARRSRDAAQKYFTRPIVTALEPAPTFWPAEEYHQQYLEKRGLSSCHL